MKPSVKFRFARSDQLVRRQVAIDIHVRVDQFVATSSNHVTYGNTRIAIASSGQELAPNR